jgi:hypothetical protein
MQHWAEARVVVFDAPDGLRVAQTMGVDQFLRLLLVLLQRGLRGEFFAFHGELLFSMRLHLEDARTLQGGVPRSDWGRGCVTKNPESRAAMGHRE